MYAHECVVESWQTEQLPFLQGQEESWNHPRKEMKMSSGLTHILLEALLLKAVSS